MYKLLALLANEAQLGLLKLIEPSQPDERHYAMISVTVSVICKGHTVFHPMS